MASFRVSILFDEPNKDFAPEDIVSGTVVVENSEPINARSIEIRWKGTSVNRSSKTITLKGKESVWSSKELNQLPAGTHEYPFTFTLPRDCASTIKTGNIRNKYKVKVVIDRPWKFNYILEKEFTVVNPIWVISEEVRGEEDDCCCFDFCMFWMLCGGCDCDGDDGE